MYRQALIQRGHLPSNKENRENPTSEFAGPPAERTKIIAQLTTVATNAQTEVTARREAENAQLINTLCTHFCPSLSNLQVVKNHCP